MSDPIVRQLDDLDIGESARVVGYLEVNDYSERLLRLGLIPGTQVTLQRRAPLGDPVEIRFRGYSLVLRPSEAMGEAIDEQIARNYILTRDSERSLLSEIGRTITPAFSPMGITDDNWQATVGIFTGIFAKEVVVGTLDALYSPADTKVPVSMTEQLVQAFESVPANLRDLDRTLLDPLVAGAGLYGRGGDLSTR